MSEILSKSIQIQTFDLSYIRGKNIGEHNDKNKYIEDITKGKRKPRNAYDKPIIDNGLIHEKMIKDINL